MKKLLFLRLLSALLTLLFLHPAAWAHHVPVETAAAVAQHFYRSTPGGAALTDNAAFNLVFTASTDATDLVYAFNTNNGFVLVAADDALTPILGYSTSGTFDPNNVPEALQKWLDGYRAEIFWAIETDLKATPDIRDQWQTLQNGVPDGAEEAGVAPLLQTTWNQSPYYNASCPGGSVTGCVATAMGQIMAYWQHPAQGKGSHSYVENDYGTLSADFGSTIYQWGFMPHNVTSPNQPVATLLYHCGVALDMNYSPSGSGAATSNVPACLTTYFGYDPTSATFVERAGYTENQWIALLKQELDAGRPVQYRGTGSGGGHSFVCDGYDNNNFFHFNWGWGGSSDGYFSVNALNPGSLGVGGGTGGFNNGQGAAIGLQPDPTLPPNLQMTSQLFVTPAVVAGTPLFLIADLANAGSQSFGGYVALGIYDQQDGRLVRVLEDQTQEFFNLFGAGAHIEEQLNLPPLPPGQYTASLVYHPYTSTSWVRIPDGQFSNSASFGVISSNELSVYEVPTLSQYAVAQNTPFSATARLQNLTTTAPFFNNTVSIDLHDLNGDWIQEIAEIPNQIIFYGLPSDPLTFSSNGLNVPPGTYQVVLWALGSNGWSMVGVPFDYDATTYLTVLPPPPPPDLYEPNNGVASAFAYPLFFSDEKAYVTTVGADNHNPSDEDYYKIALPNTPTYYYTVSGRLQDSYSSNNGGTYTNDCLWSFNNGVSWSEPFDDVMLVPGQEFSMAAGTTAYFYVRPYFAGTSGSYLLDLQITRHVVSATHEALPANAFAVAPNPASDWLNLTVQQSDLQAETLQLYNTAGQLVLQQKATDASLQQIQTEGLVNGLYLVKVNTNLGVWSTRVSILH